MPSARSLQVLEHIETGEREARFWAGHLDRLTRRERRLLSRGELGAIIRPVEPAWEVGDRLEVASNLSIEVTAVRWRRRDYLTTFNVQDFRPLFIRRAVPVFDPPALDEYGEPVPPSAEKVADARREGNYTRDGSRGVPGAGEAVDLETQDRITAEGLRNYNAVHAAEIAKREIRSLTATLKRVRGEALKKEIDITPEVARIKSEVAALQKKVTLGLRYPPEDSV